jgi:Transmembrane secretion effector
MQWFPVESWVERLRQHQRVSQADAYLQREVLKFHLGRQRPVLHHLLAL